jgi:hypothetical protein
MITIIVPYYRNPLMLERQIEEWNLFPTCFRFIVVDDGSPEPAAPIVEAHAHGCLRDCLAVYRIGVDIPWNRGGARNLGSHVAQTDWLVHIDIDHVLPWECAQPLATFIAHPARWYRFPRFRQGRADATRRKDKISPEERFGQIHPHVDSFLCTRELFWKVGGYDEDYSGCLGGGNPFLKQLERAAAVELLPPEIHLHVYTRDAVPDASDTTLSRSSEEYSRRRREKDRTGRTRALNPLRFPWGRVL